MTDYCGVLLAGGQSSRMGTDKALLELGGFKTIQWVDEKLSMVTDQRAIITNQKERFAFVDIPSYPDVFKGEGPMAGLHAAIHYLPSDYYLLSACDTPFLSPAVYEVLKQQVVGHDIAIPVFNGKFHPMSGVYSVEVYKKAGELLNQGKRSMKALFNETDTVFVDQFPSIDTVELERHFFNMNDPKDYEKAQEIVKIIKS
ncbi:MULTISPECIES: molybdenum cofactor guanylyltransferase [Thalassobacillus]|uniref:molybdenum cofactor guanylyltransferase n=1 Tax=Thalassobacillus TaxID=331971 RepID=UPI000A1CC172|nr:molybdenum cofactor guanylyltransferase [Thalassobacillus devorans]